ncbi:MAG: UDP-N-acetylmuramoyl-tripeptide--D-alanyl-D-alanine ligase [Deltaproteobacteria bacterium]|nr:UDP-N-acetylmuramoyl-tripeptide--D-alanyl-D-alanine ligase [Deltaproteobacteria bacterium]MBW2503296.1 UDP-N-acetylmuramoyl-tripeptide--D-alanyl-D-alanine ligase [Deltaproteobacteria bacterium]
MNRMAISKIVEIIGGRLIQNGAKVTVNGFSTDSRSLQAGELFIPLRGERYDGHDFLAQAVSHGAAACLSEEVVAGLHVPVIQVADTLKALGDLAAWKRLQFSGPVVGITGSSGKTTCKEMLANILGQIGPGLKSAGNFNNLIGVPLTLFGLQPEHLWAVVEMGMSARGEITRLTEITRPQIGVITNVAAAHLETLGGIKGVARAKGELLINLPSGGTAIINADDQEVSQLPVANGVRRVLFGTSSAAEVRAENVRAINGSVSFTLWIENDRREVNLPVPGRHNVSNALAAAAAGTVLDVDIDGVVSGLEAFRPCPGRMELIELPDDIVVLEDSYNANPLSVRAALDALHDLGRPGRCIAVLGDMLELGEAAAELHREIGYVAADCVDWLFTKGPLAREIALGALDKGLAEDRVYSFDDDAKLAGQLLKILKPGDRILIKGSRGMRMELITAQLRTSHLGFVANSL